MILIIFFIFPLLKSIRTIYNEERGKVSVQKNKSVKMLLADPEIKTAELPCGQNIQNN